MSILKKSEILFLYESSYNIPNGDPFTGEQRYDEETKQILVSDVRMKRFTRDYLDKIKGETIYIKGKDITIPDDEIDKKEDTTKESDPKKKEGSGSARRIDELSELFKKELETEKEKLFDAEIKQNPLKKKDDKEEIKKVKEKINKSFSNALFVMKKCIDVRLFGGISTKQKDAVNLTGPVQFALLNPSFNKVTLRMHQNTSTLESKESNKQGAIATTTLVPYSLIQIHGWFNPKVGEQTGITEGDIKLMFEGLWYGTSGDGSSHSRSKVGQNSVLMLEIVYVENNKKVYGVDRLIKLNTKGDKKEEQLRNMDDYTLDFSKLIDIANSEKVQIVNYYTEIEKIDEQFKGNPKFKKLSI